MSLTKEAIEHIEQAAIAVAEHIGDEPVDFPFRLVPASMKLEDLEPYMRLRNQYRATMNTESIDDFSAYFNDNEGGNCFINAESMSARTIFDLGGIEKPEHCNHKAILSLRKTAAFKELESINGEHKNQRDMADWIEEWHDLIEAVGDDEGKSEIQLAKAINAIRKLTIEEVRKSDHEVSNFRTSKTAMETIEAKSDEGMPGYFDFTCTPYEGLREQTFRLRLNILKSHEKPQFLMRIQLFDSITEELAKEFQELLAKKLPEECNTYIGTLAV